MTTSTITRLSRNIALGLGAIVISTMTLAGANQAQAKVSIHLDFGGFSVHGGHGHWSVHNCHYYKHMWYKTGYFHWKKKYYQCKGWW